MVHAISQAQDNVSSFALRASEDKSWAGDWKMVFNKPKTKEEKMGFFSWGLKPEEMAEIGEYCKSKRRWEEKEAEKKARERRAIRIQPQLPDICPHKGETRGKFCSETRSHREVLIAPDDALHCNDCHHKWGQCSFYHNEHEVKRIRATSPKEFRKRLGDKVFDYIPDYCKHKWTEGTKKDFSGIVTIKFNIDPFYEDKCSSCIRSDGCSYFRLRIYHQKKTQVLQNPMTAQESKEELSKFLGKMAQDHLPSYCSHKKGKFTDPLTGVEETFPIDPHFEGNCQSCLEFYVARCDFGRLHKKFAESSKLQEAREDHSISKSPISAFLSRFLKKLNS